MKKIGLTGVIGAGKSSVIKILKEQNIPVLDCDKINTTLQEKGKAGYVALVEAFTDCILDEHKEIDRIKMSDVIFSDNQKRKQVEAILHPLIKAQITTELAKLKGERLAVIEVPLLFEVAWEAFFDEIWVVASEEELLLQRLQKHRQVSEKEAKRRLQAQMSQEDKIAKAHVVIWNNGDLESLKQQIYAIL